MPTKKDKPKKQFLTSRSTTKQKLLLLSIGALLLVNDLFLFGGNIRFYAKWVECGKMPVAATLSGGEVVGFGVPNYYDAQALDLFRGQPEYFCTPLQAERAGYSATSSGYEFKYLPKDQWQDAIDKSQHL